MTNLERFKHDRDDLLLAHLNQIGSYDLERLKTCFESEYDYDIENRDSLDNILFHIRKILSERESQNI